MNRHQFELLAKQFRGGRIRLDEFADQICGPKQPPGEPTAAAQLSPSPPSELRPRLPARSKQSHKNDFGHVLVIAGCRNMPGAAALTGLAAARSGCGLVTVATPFSAQAVVAGFSPVLMTAGCPEDADGTFSNAAFESLNESLNRASMIAIGPGMGRSPGAAALVERVYHEAKVPVLVDADGLNCLVLNRVSLDQHAGPRILTPHLGELCRLLKESVGAGSGKVSLQELEPLAAQLAKQAGITLVAKSHQTLVLATDVRWSQNQPNSGLAKGGSGDVLTGILASLVAQGLAPVEAAVTGCALHALAGQIARKKKSAAGMIALDLVESLPEALLASEKAWLPDDSSLHRHDSVSHQSMADPAETG